MNLTLNGKTSVTIGPFTQVSGDVAASGPKGSVLFDVASSQYYYYGYGGNVLASTVDVNIQASVGHIYGNLITVDGSAGSQTLGLDPAALPPIPAGTAAAPGTTNVSVPANQARQLCPGQYGAISLAAGATLNLNGGVYDLTKLTLADGAKLEPSEPVVLLISGNMTTGTGAFVGPYPDVVNPITAGDIRIEAGGNITIGDSTQVRAHLLAPTGKLTTGKSTNLTGAGWAKIINIGPQSNVIGEGTFSAVAPSVPPPCNDNNACTADTCVGGGTAFGSCRNAPVPSGTSCADGNLCNGAETCNGAGTCEPGTPLAAGASCADGNACNGAETCNGSGTCEPGTPPVVSDDNSCTTDSCDPTAGVSHVALPDGSTCSGIGVCEAGTCSVQGAVYSADFFQFGDTTNQCNSWNDFLNNQVVDNSYSRVTMSGTFDLTGITCNDPASATQICQAIHQGNSASVSCGGHTWNVGQCGGTELSIDIGTCFCSFGAEHTVRPCTGFDDWGGVNTETCDGPSQTMTVACQ
ncbi:MAG TPA: hypothetical protein VH165_22660 [Kofleriaceae bacterium]|nr:hypothetical protein [Kofleriaceae bacterium]